MGESGQTSGAAITSAIALASRFSLDSPLQVNSIGGHLGGSPQGPEIFGAILALDSPSALPHGSPFDEDELLAWTTFEPTYPSSDLLVPLSVMLQPGDYALIFGSGQFGETGIGFMPLGIEDNPGSSYMSWGLAGWTEDTNPGKRFVVEGIYVPEFGTITMIVFGFTIARSPARRPSDLSSFPI